MNGEQWKMSADGWMTEKSVPSEPDEWYEIRYVDEDGNELHGWMLFSEKRVRQYRRRSPEAIQAIVEKRSNQRLAYYSLPAFRADRRCPKCSSPELAKTRWQDASDEYGDNGVLHRICRGCRYTWIEKPVSDLEFSP